MHTTIRHRLIGLLTAAVVVVGFALLAFVVVVSASGYRFDFSNFVFTKTGLISLRVTPHDAVITLDGTVVPNSNGSVVLRYLLPGRYTIVAREPGYRSWRSVVYLDAGQAVTRPTVNLILDTTPVIASADVAASGSTLDTSDLLISGDELWTKPIINPYLHTTGGDDVLVARFSQPIVQAAWLFSQSYIVYQVDNALHIMYRDGTNDILLATLGSNDPAVLRVSSDGTALLYTDGTNNYERTLINKSNGLL